MKTNTELGLPELPKGIFFRIKEIDDAFLGMGVRVQLRQRRKKYGSRFLCENKRCYVRFQEDIERWIKEGKDPEKAPKNARECTENLAYNLWTKYKKDQSETAAYFEFVGDGLGDIVGDHPPN